MWVVKVDTMVNTVNDPAYRPQHVPVDRYVRYCYMKLSVIRSLEFKR
jgi:hypothetical protein